MKRKVNYLPILASAFLVLSAIFIVSMANNPSFNSALGIHHGDIWCSQITKADGTILPAECGLNTYTNAGMNATRDLLGSGIGTAGFKYIALGNLTVPDATSTTLAGEYTTGGLQRALGTYFSLPQNGNWTISKTFTSTADALLVNTTGLFNASSGGSMLAGFSFTSATLQTNDQITINSTIWSS